MRFLPIMLLTAALWVGISASARAQVLSAADRAALEAQLAQVEAEAAQAQAQLSAAQAQSASYQKNINVLTAQIKAEQLDIQAKTLLIKTLGDNITTKQSQINDLEAHIATEKASIADMFRDLEKADEYSLVEVLLSRDSISGFIDDSNRLESLQNQLDDLSAELADTEASTSAAKDALVTKQNAAIDARYAIQQEQNKVKADQATLQQYLATSKKNEAAQSALLSQKRAQADQISAKLFTLAGGSNPIPFGTAYQYAKIAQQKTGVDPAFLLAIFTQETNLGSNQGTCYLTDSTTGAGINIKKNISVAKVMNPSRDVPPYLTLAASLGIDPYHTVVSCPQAVGWGGAMGAAQFISSTWVLFANRVATALGLATTPNPWNPEHAFMASALYLSDLGASSGSYTAESRAACKYYGSGGSTCTYSKSVMALASKIQTTEIDQLNY